MESSCQCSSILGGLCAPSLVVALRVPGSSIVFLTRLSSQRIPESPTNFYNDYDIIRTRFSIIDFFSEYTRLHTLLRVSISQSQARKLISALSDLPVCTTERHYRVDICSAWHRHRSSRRLPLLLVMISMMHHQVQVAHEPRDEHQMQVLQCHHLPPFRPHQIKRTDHQGQ
jgi:hypothetical protein